MKKILLLTWGTLLFLGSTAQSIRGVVKGADGGNLSSVNLVLLNQNISTTTNINGAFRIDDLEPKAYKLQISFIGKSTIIKNIDLSSTRDFNLGEIKMQESAFKTDEIVVTATKTPRLLSTIPASIEYLSEKDINLIPSQKIDENLKYTSGVYVDRKFGIFGKSVVAMRGVVGSEPGRQLTLIDGVPINKSDGGGTNWNRIINLDIQHIEAIKGPTSSVYGSNAMGGTINLISKRPQKKAVQASAKTYYGTYNTLGAEFNVMQKFNENNKGFYYSISGKALKSDGYNTVPDSMRNETDTLVFVEEQAINTRLGYKFSNKSFLEIEYNYYNDHRGQGTKIRLQEGSTADYDTHFFKSKYKNQIAKFNIDVNTFYQLEKYLRTIEKEKKGNYTLINVNSDRQDYGLLTSVSRSFGSQKLSLGVDYRNGSVYGVDAYETSSDKIINQGKIAHVDLFLQDEISFSENLKSIAAIHYAYVKFYEGAFVMEDATGINDFMNDDLGSLEDEEWMGWSPSLAFQYNLSKHFSTYINVSSGFRTASLDDLTRTGFISIGYKKANPMLKPETINNIEIGTRYKQQKFLSSVNAYYSRGYDFMYYVATGESLFGGRKKVYKKENISEVEISGVELSGQYNLLAWLSFKINYTYNHSIIKKFEERMDLEGMFLTYAPSNMANFSTSISKKKLGASFNVHWQDKVFLDEENTFTIEPLFGFDLRLSYEIYKGFGAGINIQNILDEQHLVSTDQVSLGRFITFEFNYILR